MKKPRLYYHICILDQFFTFLWGQKKYSILNNFIFTAPENIMKVSVMESFCFLLDSRAIYIMFWSFAKCVKGFFKSIEAYSEPF